jgi:staphylococcal nuclease domain-containing protein 1
MGRRATPEFMVTETEPLADGSNGDAPLGSGATLTSAQRFAQSVTASSEVPPDPFAREAKHFTEIRVLNRDVSSFPSQFLILLSLLIFCAQFTVQLQHLFY